MFSQTPALQIAEERVRALEWVSGASRAFEGTMFSQTLA